MVEDEALNTTKAGEWRLGGGGGLQMEGGDSFWPERNNRALWVLQQLIIISPKDPSNLIKTCLVNLFYMITKKVFI